MKVNIVISVALLAVALIMFPVLLDGAHDTVADNQVDTFAGTVDSGTPNYQASVTLTQPLYNDIGYITTVASSSGTDTPVAVSYTSATRALLVNGLNAGAPGTASRTLTVTYEYSAAANYTGLEPTVEIAPLVIFTGLILAGGYTGFSHYRSKKRKSRPGSRF